MTRDDLLNLLDFHYWARDRVLDAVAPLSEEERRLDLGSSFPSVHATLVHTYAAEWVWHERWHGRSPDTLLSPDLFPDFLALRKAWLDLETGVRGFVGALDETGVARVHEYRLLSGAPGRSAFWQMLQHVVNHATYHRGQVTTMLRQLGKAAPKSTDLVAYYREKA